MNNLRISGRVIQVAEEPESLQFLLQFRTNRDNYVLVKVFAPLIREKLRNLSPGWKVRVIGFLKSEDDKLYAEAFSVIPDETFRCFPELRHKFLGGAL